jgi:hypothetical protein
MPTPTWTRIVVLTAAALSGILALIFGAKIDSDLLRVVLPASSGVIVLLWVFDRWLWRWSWINHFLSRPVLDGTWKCVLRTNYAERAGEEIDAYLVIDQTCSRICVRMLFDRSQSISMSGDLVNEGGRCILYYVFRSEKHAFEPDTNPPARGAADLRIGRKPKIHLEGDYWMERGTTGRLLTVGYSDAHYDTFDAAKGGTYK